MVDGARYLLGAATIGMGIVDLVWGALDPAHQPIQAWGDDIPGSHVLAYIIGIALVAGGTALFVPISQRFGALTIAGCYLVFTIFWLPRLYTAPLVLGLHASIVLGVLAGVCTEIVVVCAAILLYASATLPKRSIGRAGNAIRWIFGLSVVVFGLNHLFAIEANVIYVPHWMPLGRPFWVIFTGAAFVLAGIAILTERLDVEAARLLAVMWLIFSVVTLIPGLIHAPQYEANWGGNVYEFVAIASSWTFAEWRATVKVPIVNRPAQP